MGTGRILRWCQWKHPKYLEIKIEHSKLLTTVNFSHPYNLSSNSTCTFSMLWSIMYQYLKYKQQHLYSKRKWKKAIHPVELREVLSSPLENRNGSLNALSQNYSEEVGSYTGKIRSISIHRSQQNQRSSFKSSWWPV